MSVNRWSIRPIPRDISSCRSIWAKFRPASVRVELFADAAVDMASEVLMLHQEQAIPGSTNGYIYAGAITTTRPIEDFTVRVVPYHPNALLPAELPLIAWQH